MYIISREYWFSAAHRLEGHPKCGRLHGHNYKVVVAVKATILDDNGFVVDFGELDQIVKPIIDEWDHHYLVSFSNLEAGDKIAEVDPHCLRLQIEATSAENLAEELFVKINNRFKWDPYSLDSITVWETPKSSAVYRDK